jgi:hypothetical protein
MKLGDGVEESDIDRDGTPERCAVLGAEVSACVVVPGRRPTLGGGAAKISVSGESQCHPKLKRGESARDGPPSAPPTPCPIP